MQTTISFKIPRELKEKMKAIPVRWSTVVRDAIEREIVKYERDTLVTELLNLTVNAPRVPKGTTVKVIRELREEG